MFPRSASAVPGKHGTFADVQQLLPYVASMGFDVLYLPPIHPVGVTERKGPNNNPTSAPGDPGSPWAIGGAGGGHKAIHPELGTLEDFKQLLAKAASTVSKSRWTSHSRRHPTIRMFESTPSGF